MRQSYSSLRGPRSCKPTYNVSIRASSVMCLLKLKCVLSHIQLFGIPWTIGCQAPLSMEFSRQEYWNGLPLPPAEELPNPVKPTSLDLVAKFFTMAPSGNEVYGPHFQRNGGKSEGIYWISTYVSAPGILRQCHGLSPQEGLNLETNNRIVYPEEGDMCIDRSVSKVNEK